MPVVSFTMRLYKQTKQKKLCFDELTDRIGQVFLHASFAEQIGIGNKLVVQLARFKEELGNGGYQTKMIPDKQTINKVRYKEIIGEPGELGSIYVAKEVLEYLGLESKQELAVRILPSDPQKQSEGGKALAEA